MTRKFPKPVTIKKSYFRAGKLWVVYRFGNGVTFKQAYAC